MTSGTMAFDSGFVKQIVVYASELASAIDQHPYKPREETALGVWKRFDRTSFAFSVSLGYIHEVFDLTKNFMKGKPTRYPLPNEVDSDEGKQGFIQVLKHIFTGFEWPRLRQKIMDFVDTKEFREAKEKVLLNALGEKEKVTEAMAALCSEEKKTVHEKLEEVCKKITEETGKDVDKQTQDALRSKLSRERGTNLEAKTVTDYAAASGKAVRREPAKLYRKIINHEDMSWLLCGRVDARDENTIVEVKNRTRRFMCPDYDVLQLQTYMFLCGKRMGILLERLHGKNNETPFEFNESYWNNAIVPALYEFVCDVESKVIASRSVLDSVTPYLSPRKRCHSPTPQLKIDRDIVDESPVKGPKRISEGSSWDNARSSDEFGSSDPENQEDSFVLYLSPSDTESDEELANLDY